MKSLKSISILAFFFAFLLSFVYSHSQQYQPFPTDTAKWDVARCWYLFQAGWYDHYEITIDGSDTLYQSQTYKKIFIKEHQAHGSFDSIYPPQFFGGIRESNKQVFIFQKWASVDTTEHLVYDFTSTNVGDTIYTSCLAGPASTMLGHLVTATDSVLVGSQYHKRLFLEDPTNSFNAEQWIEGVGSSWGLPFASFWSITDNSYDLICFYENIFKYGNPNPTFGFCTPPFPPVTCDTIVISLDENTINNQPFDIYPNPARNKINIRINTSDITDYELTIIDWDGREVQKIISDKNSFIMDTGSLSNGIYFLKLRSGQGIYSRRMIIQH